MNTEPVEDLSTDELLEHYNWVVRRNHYDPVASDPPPYNEDELEAELRRRLRVYEQQDAN